MSKQSWKASALSGLAAERITNGQTFGRHCKMHVHVCGLGGSVNNMCIMEEEEEQEGASTGLESCKMLHEQFTITLNFAMFN